MYEGTGLGTRHMLELFDPARVVAVGGGTRSDLWLRTVSDVAGIRQEVPEQTLGAAYGDALLAAIGVGLVPPETDWTRSARTVEPGPHGALYDELFDLYRRLYTETADTVHRLTRSAG
jgi:xylulokinase